MEELRYQDYQAEDFVLDAHFRQWVVQGEDQAGAFWAEWLEANPEKKEQVQQAILFLRQVRVTEGGLPPEEAQLLFASIEDRISTPADTPAIPFSRATASNGFWTRMAAVILVLVLSAAALLLLRTRENLLVRQTAFGVMQEVLLPDSSVVVLNGNSTLRFAPAWPGDGPREVWIEGEGYFKVRQKPNRQPFLVHFSADHTVEVLGTTFTVTDRESVQRVVLNTGKVRLSLPHKGAENTFDLLPGDLVELKKGAAQPERRRVNPAVYAAWTEQVLMFDDTPLGEVATFLEETYGLQIIIADSALYRKKLVGSTPLDADLEMLFTGLEETFNLKVTRANGVVTLERKAPLK